MVKKVSSTLPLQGVAAVKQLPHIQQLKLADPTFYQSGEIDILLGGDVLPQVMLPDMKTGAANSPVAWNTIFGWVIFGPFQSGQKNNNSHTHCMNHFVHDKIPSNNPTKQVEKPEESPINLVTFTSDEKELELPIDKLIHLFLPLTDFQCLRHPTSNLLTSARARHKPSSVAAQTNRPL